MNLLHLFLGPTINTGSILSYSIGTPFMVVRPDGDDDDEDGQKYAMRC